MGTPLSSYQGALMAESRRPDTVMMMGDNPEFAEDARAPGAQGLLRAAFRQDPFQPPSAKRQARTRARAGREGDHGLPAARYRHRRAAVGPSWLLGGANGRAVCR